MWFTIGRRTSAAVKPLSLDDLSVHRVSAGTNKYYRLCFPRGLGGGATTIKFARDQERKLVAVVAYETNVSDSFHVSIDKRVGKKYVTFKAGDVPGVKPGKYFASVPRNPREGPVTNGRVLFYLHPAK